MTNPGNSIEVRKEKMIKALCKRNGWDENPSGEEWQQAATEVNWFFGEWLKNLDEDPPANTASTICPLMSYREGPCYTTSCKKEGCAMYNDFHHCCGLVKGSWV